MRSRGESARLQPVRPHIGMSGRSASRDGLSRVVLSCGRVSSSASRDLRVPRQDPALRRHRGTPDVRRPQSPTLPTFRTGMRCLGGQASAAPACSAASEPQQPSHRGRRGERRPSRAHLCLRVPVLAQPCAFTLGKCAAWCAVTVRAGLPCGRTLAGARRQGVSHPSTRVGISPARVTDKGRGPRLQRPCYR